MAATGDHQPAEGRDVSVVVPTFDDGGLLSRCLSSIVAQSLPPREIIVVDDGSADPAALAGLAEAMAKFPDVLFLRQPNAGPSAARNLGLERCSGAYVAFVDADDELLADSLRIRRDLFDLHPGITASYCGIRFVEPDGREQASAYRTGRRPLEIDGIGLRGGVPGFLWAYMFRKAAVVAAGGCNETLTIMEDFDLLARIGRAGGAFAGTDEPGYVQHRGAASLSRASARRQLAGALRFLAEARRQRYFSRAGLIRRYLRLPMASLKIILRYRRR